MRQQDSCKIFFMTQTCVLCSFGYRVFCLPQCPLILLAARMNGHISSEYNNSVHYSRFAGLNLCSSWTRELTLSSGDVFSHRLLPGFLTSQEIQYSIMSQSSICMTCDGIAALTSCKDDGNYGMPHCTAVKNFLVSLHQERVQ